MTTVFPGTDFWEEQRLRVGWVSKSTVEGLRVGHRLIRHTQVQAVARQEYSNSCESTQAKEKTSAYQISQT
jgi:hypothetical protein